MFLKKYTTPQVTKQEKTGSYETAEKQDDLHFSSLELINKLFMIDHENSTTAPVIYNECLRGLQIS